MWLESCLADAPCYQADDRQGWMQAHCTLKLVRLIVKSIEDGGRGREREARNSRLSREHILWKACTSAKEVLCWRQKSRLKKLPQEMLHMYASMLKPSLAVRLGPKHQYQV